jgi:DNA invertase Pin-like site-specific DNA recombinase
MRENEEKLDSIAAKKARIRERYKGISSDELDIIPALPQENFYETIVEKRVAVYARVSTDDPNQTSSYELQKNHYQDVVSKRPNWKLVEIYADEGISGTSLQHRDAFIKMINDCKERRIDLIITKSVSRFARNVVDCIGYVRELKSLNPPIGVFFETENIYTLNSNSEMSLSFISTLAQEESHNKSEIMNASIEMRFGRGIFLTPPLLGFDQDADGNLVINEEESKTVRLIFFMYLYGYTCMQIADILTQLGRKTKKDNTKWSPGSILNVLQNERHCGDILARKTWTPDYLNHKSKKNKQDRNQYRQRNHHEAIVSRDDFMAVQMLIRNARYGNKGILPELHVIKDGVLKGFVPINPRWASFKADDYRDASASIYDGILKQSSFPMEVEAQSGDFDLRGYEIARGQFFDTANRISVTFSYDNVSFSTKTVRLFENIKEVEMLVQPHDSIFAIRPSASGNRNSVQWSRFNNDSFYPKTISGTAFLPVLFELFNWKPECKYRILGIKQQKDSEAVILFNMHDTEILIPSSLATDDNNNAKIPEDVKPFMTSGKKSILAYPPEWVDSFGNSYYRHAQAAEIVAFNETRKWDVHMEGSPYKEPELQITSANVIRKNINEIIDDMKEATNEQSGNNE